MILAGRIHADEILDQVRRSIQDMRMKPRIVVVLIGEDPSSQIYVTRKQEACKSVGIACEIVSLPTHTPAINLVERIQSYNSDPDITGILIQSPLPARLDFGELSNLIHPRKDIDGLTTYNIGLLARGDRSGIVPATARGIVLLFEKYKIDLVGKHVVIIGRSMIVGRPIGCLLLQTGATVTWCHRRTQDIGIHTRQADIIICAAGQRNLLTQDRVSPGTVVIDVGINRNDHGTIVGDADFDALQKTCDITPVPGGVGPLTIACLMLNILDAYKLQHD